MNHLAMCYTITKLVLIVALNLLYNKQQDGYFYLSTIPITQANYYPQAKLALTKS